MLKKRKLIPYVLVISMLSFPIPSFAQNENKITILPELKEEFPLNDQNQGNSNEQTESEETSESMEITESTETTESMEITESTETTEISTIEDIIIEESTQNITDDNIDLNGWEEQEPSPEEPLEPINFALGLNREKIAASSEAEKEENPPRTIEAAFDGDYTTRWASDANINADKPETAQWLAIDLGEAKTFNKFKIAWESAYGKEYKIEASDIIEDRQLIEITDWKEIYKQDNGKGEIEDIGIEPVTSRYLKITITKSGNSGWPAASIYEWEIYNYTEEYIIDSGLTEIGNYKIPRYPTENFLVPLKTKNGAVVNWKSENSAISIDENTGKATVTLPVGNDSSGKLTASLSYGGVEKSISFDTTVYQVNNQLVEYKIYPMPQKLTRNGAKTQITKSINVVCESDISESTKNRAKEVLEKNGYTVEFNDTKSNTISNIILKIYEDGDGDTYSIPTNALSKEEGGQMGEWNVYDAHVVKIGANVENNGDILVVGKHEDALYYGLATVEQILEQAESENKITSITIEDFSNSEYRGIIEGFYGFAYSTEDIESLLEFGKRYKMNCFLYGPKADPYHLGKWKSAYPTTLTDEQRKNGMLTQDDIKEIAEFSKESHIEFVWTIHPMMEDGIILEDSEAVTQGIKDVLAKYELMYNLGIRQFGLFVDDISVDTAVKNSDAQARLISEVTSGLKAKYPDTFKPVFYVPTVYSLDATNEEGKVKNFGTLANINNLEDIILTFTGYGVFSSIQNEQMKTMANYIDNKQKPMFWWNSPVNDNTDNNLYLGPTDMRYSMDNDVKDTIGMMTNPMNQAEASKIALFGMLDYSWNVAEFNSTQNWLDSIPAMFPDDSAMAKNFKIFADHNSPNAFIGEKSSVNYSGVEDIIADIKKEGGKTTDNLNKLKEKMQELKDACTYLRTNLKNSSNKKYANLYEESEPWINKCYTVADIYIKALNLELGINTDIKFYYDAAYDYSRLSIDPEFYMTSLEGAGTEVFETKQEVYVGGNVLINYMPTVLGWAREKIQNKLPEASPELNVTMLLDIDDKTGITMSDETNDGFIISGLKGKILKPGQYIGMSMPELVSVEKISELISSLPKGLTVQYSSNGKTWNNYIVNSENGAMSSLRVFNISQNPITFENDSVTIGAHSMLAVASNATSDMGQYGTNPVKPNVYDGDWSTFYWSSGSPKVGKYMQVDYAKPFQMQSLQMVFSTADNLDEQSIIEVSKDGENWTKIARLNGQESDSIQADIIEKDGEKYQVFNINGINVNISHIRMTIEKIVTTGYSNWMKCYEVLPNGGKTVPLANASAGRGASNVLDNNLDSVFLPLKEEAANLTYTLLDPRKIDYFDIYMIPNNELPKVEVKSGRDWKEVSIIQNTDVSMPYLYKVDISNVSNVSELKFSWEKDNVPKVFYDIYYRLSENTEASPSKTQLVVTYQKALSANKSEYTENNWKELQDLILLSVDIINFQSTKEEIDSIINKLEKAINNKIPDPTPEVPDSENPNHEKPSSGSSSGNGKSSLKASNKKENESELSIENKKDDKEEISVKKELSINNVKLPQIADKQNNFKDINNYKWAESYIAKLYSAGIISGVDNNNFNPNGFTKKSDFIIMIMKTLGIEGKANSNFNDVMSNSYYYNYVGLAKEYGIISGSGSNTFNPDQTISRQDTMVIIANILKSIDAEVNTDISVLNQFTDSDNISEYAKESVAILVNSGIIIGNENKIDAKSNITRAQMCVIVSKLYDSLKEYSIK